MTASTATIRVELLDAPWVWNSAATPEESLQRVREMLEHHPDATVLAHHDETTRWYKRDENDLVEIVGTFA